MEQRKNGEWWEESVTNKQSILWVKKIKRNSVISAFFIFNSHIWKCKKNKKSAIAVQLS
ncbi:hypothetical protein HMPREF9514_02869 [Enterococcus faecalis TX0855]|nr:hypothetical protein HMPREF9514_02869 [Enterococcus faecalis TX0855]EPH78621.1 hypothetical protein D926_00344 [Enterococcus faecalis D811610-10]